MYITTNIPKKEYQITFEDILFGIKQKNIFDERINLANTKTIYREETPQKLIEAFNISAMIDALKLFNAEYQDLIQINDKSKLYTSFKIPKRSGGMRQIDAPINKLMKALRDLKDIFERDMFAKHHTSAFAYVKKRSIIECIKRHQENESKWFLKLDFHNFFGSTTFDFTINMLKEIFPFNEILKSEEGKIELEKSLSLCFLNGGLPQGTPISPTLTNLIMVPIDHHIAKFSREYKTHLVYTRYADDMLISSNFNFMFTEVQNEIIKILKEFNAPFELNTKKTRYGSSAGSNWNLGLMLNKDNQITIGNKRKQLFKATLFSFLKDNENNKSFELSELQSLLGLINYYRQVEKTTIDKILEHYSYKFNVDVNKLIIQKIKSFS